MRAINSGAQNASWEGLSPVLSSVERMLDYFNSTQGRFMDALAEPAGNDDFSLSKAALDMIAQKYDASSAPAYTVTNPLTGDSGYVLEIRYGWKSYNGSFSLMYPLYQEREAFRTDVYNKIVQLRASSHDGVSVQNLISEANNSMDDVRDLIKNIQSARDKLYDYAEISDAAFSSSELVLNVFYSLALATGVLAVAGCALYIINGVISGRYMIQTVWPFLALLTLSGLILSAGLLPAAAIMVELCEAATVDTLKDVVPGEVWDRIAVCFIGNGDLDREYNLTGKLEYAKKIANESSIATSMYDNRTGRLLYPLSTQYVSTVFVSAILPR